MAWGSAENIGQLVDVIVNNLNYYIQRMIVEWGATTTLLVVGLLLAFMTMLIFFVIGSHHTHTNRCCARHS